MGTIIGFTIILGGEAKYLSAALAAQKRALSYFTDLDQLSISIGETTLNVWGRDNLSKCMHYLPDGSLLLLIGSPLGEIIWPTIQNSLSMVSRPSDFEIPWDGRVILLKISPDGKQWIMWNDWLGSIPVFHAPIDKGRVASTLEPVVVASAGLTSDEIFLPALVSLLIHGHYLSDWTLFEDMRVVPPDCAAEWNERGFCYEQNLTVKPSDERWEHGWDELVDEMYELSRQAISDVLQTQPEWILPLSGGLDSRLIAAVGAEMGTALQTYTFGADTSREALYAHQVAKTLGFSWKNVSLGTNFFMKYVQQWADLFGSAMHFHGMHQMLFFDELKSEMSAPVVSGFLGDALAGYDTRFLVDFHASGDRPQIVDDSYDHWSVPEVKSLLKVPSNDALQELTLEIKKSINAVPGARFQQLRYLILWSRQRFFTYFSSMLSDYWRGVATPFINREYARFCYSLPRAVLDDRRLQADMFQRYYPRMAAIPSTYWRPGLPVGEPIKPSGSYFLKRRIAEKLPASLQRGLLLEFGWSKMSLPPNVGRATEWRSLWPIYETLDQLAEWMDVEYIAEIYQEVINGNLANSAKSIQKLQSVQTLAYRLLDERPISYGDR